VTDQEVNVTVSDTLPPQSGLERRPKERCTACAAFADGRGPYGAGFDRAVHCHT
jgi:hypothetical protein